MCGRQRESFRGCYPRKQRALRWSITRGPALLIAGDALFSGATSNYGACKGDHRERESYRYSFMEGERMRNPYFHVQPYGLKMSLRPAGRFL